MKRLMMRWEVLLLGILVLELAVFGAINPRFLNLGSLLYGTSDFVQVGIVAVPLTLVIIAGGIDVSFASTVGLCAITFGIANFFGMPLAVSLGVGFATGALAGLLNATIIRLTRLQPLVVTLGGLYMFSGAATVLSGVVGANGFDGIGGFPAAFTGLGYQMIFGLPMPLFVFLSFSLVMLVLLHVTRFGRLVFQIGQNESAARHAGMPVARVQMLTYVITGLAAALAGLLLSAYFGSARVDLGKATLLPAITAAVLGGASIYGGQGSVIGTIIATFIIGYLQQGLQMSGVPSQVSSALSGALLVVVVAMRHGAPLLREFIPVRPRPSE
ncbi:autoinducer 2 import system permease LsrD [Thioclava sp. BHET1]|uniref:Autoinducer 2 import system permease protein LsrD n=1 Tax=Thioclava dalianensis TaxID=1185766 RepID=A0A074TK85_9RHOB|nr:autoinducer 2 import system permease LsrD [Thioclava dalianensis]KEP69393.1 autoinducer 2 import system permease LsrD [Thioclava dalianensis]TMV91195.1 autoinducer 2 import system permease LsrD [Thioclava sp. BHET1]SFN03486.1 AI-2 transport system permease protein [Thioclava dalianensis]